MGKVDLEAKKRVEGQTKVQALWRTKQEIEALQKELDTIAVKKDVNMSEAEFRKTVVAPIEKKIEDKKSKLQSDTKAIKNSGDKDMVDYFNNSLKDDKDMQALVGGVSKTNNKPKPSNMGDTKTKPKKDGEAWKKFPSTYQKRVDEIDYYKTKYGEDHPWVTDTQKALDRDVMGYMWGRQKETEAKFDKVIADAEKNEDWAKAKKFTEGRKMFDKNKIDFSKMKGGDKGAASRDWDDMYEGVADPREVDVNMDRVYAGFENALKIYNEPKQEDPTTIPGEDLFPPENQTSTGGTGTGTESRTYDVDDLGMTQSTTKPVDDILDGTKDYQSELDAIMAERKNYEEFKSSQDEFQFDYRPDQQTGADTWGTLVDVGRGVMGMIGASKEIPTYSRGQMFSLAMDEAERMRNQGLSDAEIGYRQRQAETGYHYDIKNIRRLAGGSAGVALGNLGRAQTQLQDQYSAIAADDEALRRLNRENFQNMAIRDEAINRQIFQDDLRQAEMTKQAGAALVQDALSNIRERSDFNKQYGPNSIYAQYMRDKSYEAQLKNYDARQSGKKMVFDYEQDLARREAQARKGIEEGTELDGTKQQTIKTLVTEKNQKSAIPTGLEMLERTDVPQENKGIFKSASQEMTGQDLGSSLSAEDEAINKQIAEQGKSKQERFKELEKMMMETDDMDEMDRISKEMEALKL